MRRINYLLIIILLVGTVVRFWALNRYPVQLGHDEISQLYDAISIVSTGKDIYGNFLPFIFVSVNDFKPPFYTYATALMYWLFGNHEVIIRLPSVIFGSLLIPAIYLFVKQLFKSRGVATVASLLTALTPFEIFFSRKSFENGAGIFFMLIGFYLLLRFLEERKNSLVLSSGVMFALTMYTYFSHAIILPLLLVVFIFIYRDKFMFKKSLGIYFASGLISLVLLLPLIYFVITVPGSRNRSQAVFITQDVNLAEQLSYAKTFSVLDPIIRTKTILDYSFTRYLHQFDISYLFMNGLDFTGQGLMGIGPLFLAQLPFLILGIWVLGRMSGFSKERQFMLCWIFLGMIPSGLTFEPNSPHRVVMVFTMLNIIAAFGLFNFYIWLNRRQIKYLWSLKIAVSGLFLLNIIYFAHMYTVNFPYEKSQHIHYPFKEVAIFATSVKADYDQVIFDPKFGQTAPVIGTGAHYYFGFYGNTPPVQFQREYKIGSRNREVLFDKFSIREIDWTIDRTLKGSLVIVSPWTVATQDIGGFKVVKEFKYYDGQIAFYAIDLR